MRYWLRWLTLGLPSMPAIAQEAAEPAQEVARNTPDTVGMIVSLGLGLVAVIAVIYGCAWLIRRMTGMAGMNNNAIRVVSVLAIGTRERIALVEVGGQQILLGITPGSIRTLKVFEEPVVDAGNTGTSDFARKLQGLIGKSWTAPEAKE